MKRTEPLYLLILALLGTQGSSAFAQNSAPRTAKATTPASKSAPRCRTSGKEEIRIVCDYSATLGSGSGGSGEPRIVLTHASLSLGPSDESHMPVDLTFRNAGSKPMMEKRTVYLAVDGDSGQNFIRRVLPNVDFRKLAPGQQATFSDVLLIPALQAGHYSVHLWIPDSNTAQMFDSSKNLLLSTEGVPDAATGLNTLATFQVRAAAP